MTLGGKIRNRRTELGMTQPELAVASKLTQRYISRVEKGYYTAIYCKRPVKVI